VVEAEPHYLHPQQPQQEEWEVGLAEVAFEAYCESVGGQTHDGKPIPAWEDLTHEVRSAWHAAAQAVALTLSGD
jgi:hypothetical protein